MEHDAYLPAHTYANWLILAARVVMEPYRGRDATAEEIEQDRAAWQQWAESKLMQANTDSRPAAVRTTRARRIGYMADAEQDRSGARPEGRPAGARSIPGYAAARPPAMIDR